MAANSSDNQYSISFHDSAWIPILSSENVLDYFCQRTNQFYDRTCNNEVVKMQRLDPAQMQYMTGVEYALIHAQDPILYVIRKQMRFSPTQLNHLGVYYILAGVVYQAPDIGSLINSRLLSVVQKLNTAFAEVQSYSRYSPAQGYSWEFQSSKVLKKASAKAKREAPTSSVFQSQRVGLLLANFSNRFPPKVVHQPPVSKAVVVGTTPKVTVKQEDNSEDATKVDADTNKANPSEADKNSNSKLTEEVTVSVKKEEPSPALVKESNESISKTEQPPTKKRKKDT